MEVFVSAIAILIGFLLVRTRQLKLTVDGLEVRLQDVERSRSFRLQPEEPPPAAAPAQIPAPIPTPLFRPDSESYRDAEVAAESESLETRIGARWLLYIGIAAIVVGVAYFERLAIEYGWIGETARIVQGAVVGLALMFIGTRFIRRGYDSYGQMIIGGGGAILYLSDFAAFNFYSLISRPAALALMVAITMLVAWVADRYRSQGLALFAVGGGFATPFLFPATIDAQVALFTYDAILIAGTAALSRRRDWPYLHLLSYLVTVLTVAAWADRFYTPGKYLRTELYLTLYCVMFLYILHEGRRRTSGAARFVTFVLWTVPAAYYLASLANLVDHPTALLVWLVLLMLGGGILSSRAGSAAGFVVWLCVALPLLVSAEDFTHHGLTREALVSIGAVYAIALLAHLEETLKRDAPDKLRLVDIAWLHLNPLVMYGAAYLLIAPHSVDAAGYTAMGFAVWQGIIAAALWKRQSDHALHFCAVAFTLTAVAIGLLFDGAAVTAGWAVEGAAVMALALRQRLEWLRLAGFVLFAIALVQTIVLLGSPVPVTHTIVFNPRTACAALVVALCHLLAWLHDRAEHLDDRRVAVGAALVVAQFMTVTMLTAEIVAYWSIHDGRLQQQLMLSVTWAAAATAMIVVGLRRNYAPIRYFAISLFAVTIAKVFLIDLSELNRIYRVGSTIGLGTLLLLTSYLYSRARAQQRPIDDPIGRL